MNKNPNDFVKHKYGKIKKCTVLYYVHDFREHKNENDIRDCVKRIKIK